MSCTRSFITFILPVIGLIWLTGCADDHYPDLRNFPAPKSPQLTFEEVECEISKLKAARSPKAAQRERTSHETSL